MEEVRKIYVERLKSAILYGSYARSDFRPDSDIDIQKWLGVYHFYTNVQKEGVETIWNCLRREVLGIWQTTVLKQPRVI